MEGMGMGMGMGKEMEMEMEKGSSNSESRFKTLCVFSAECSGNRAIYIDAAIDLAQQLVERKIDLVYGGESVGLMAFLSHAVHRGGRRVLSVIPKILKPHEISVPMVGEVCLVADMHKRKAEMARQADGFIALPGGYGTLEELFEIITWSQLGIHDKPVGLLNVDGYYNFLLELIDKAVDEGFINLNAKRIIVSAPNARELMQRLEEYKPIHQGVAP